MTSEDNKRHHAGNTTPDSSTYDELFEEKNRLGESYARRTIQKLQSSKQILHILNTRTGGSCTSWLIEKHERRASIELTLDDSGRSADAPDVFVKGDLIHLRWMDHGIFFGAQGTIVRTDAANDAALCELQATNGVYRLQRRNDFRVPISHEDAFEVGISFDDGATFSGVTVTDLSASGLRAMIDSRFAADTGFVVGNTFPCSVSIEGTMQEIPSITIIWIERVKETQFAFGGTWTNASIAFSEQVLSIVAKKERALLRRSAGLE